MSEVDVGDSPAEVYRRLIGSTQAGHGFEVKPDDVGVMPLPLEFLSDITSKTTKHEVASDLKTAHFVHPKQLRNPKYRIELINKIRKGNAYVSQDVFEILHSFGYDFEYKQPEKPSHYILSNNEKPAWLRIISQETLDNI